MPARVSSCSEPPLTTSVGPRSFDLTPIAGAASGGGICHACSLTMRAADKWDSARFLSFFSLWVYTALKPYPPSAHLQLTPAVRKPGVFSAPFGFFHTLAQRCGVACAVSSEELEVSSVISSGPPGVGSTSLACCGHGSQSYLASMIRMCQRCGLVNGGPGWLCTAAFHEWVGRNPLLAMARSAMRYDGGMVWLAVFRAFAPKLFSRLAVGTVCALAF